MEEKKEQEMQDNLNEVETKEKATEEKLVEEKTAEGNSIVSNMIQPKTFREKIGDTLDDGVRKLLELLHEALRALARKLNNFTIYGHEVAAMEYEVQKLAQETGKVAESQEKTQEQVGIIADALGKNIRNVNRTVTELSKIESITVENKRNIVEIKEMISQLIEIKEQLEYQKHGLREQLAADLEMNGYLNDLYLGDLQIGTDKDGKLYLYNIEKNSCFTFGIEHVNGKMEVLRKDVGELSIELLMELSESEICQKANEKETTEERVNFIMDAFDEEFEKEIQKYDEKIAEMEAKKAEAEMVSGKEQERYEKTDEAEKTDIDIEM